MVTIRIESNGKEMSIRVTDDGPGLDAEIVPRLFAKFATKSDRGTGLGLFIAKNIVEAHGGRIWAENNSNGRGRVATLTFTITLPTTTHPLRFPEFPRLVPP